MIEKLSNVTDEDIKGKIYISGPITNVDNWQTNFIAAENELSELNKSLAVVNPLRISQRLEKEFARRDKFPEYADYMREDIKALADCDAICLLPGWRKSRGANLECEIAKALDMTILEFKLPKLKMPEQ